ncbi:MAG: MotA/TolQ/ExbB proton channel family protein [Algiphilus sp.]
MDTLLFTLFDIGARLQQFLDAGGPVLRVIAGVIFIMWIMSVERLFYIWRTLPKMEARAREAWEARADRGSWRARQVRRALIAGVQLDAQAYLPLIKTLVALCPMFGLLGTVTGMIAVFDVMAFSGMGNPRLMASGVSQATIPTMAGMVGALSGLFVIHFLESRVRQRVSQLDDDLNVAREG